MDVAAANSSPAAASAMFAVAVPPCVRPTSVTGVNDPSIPSPFERQVQNALQRDPAESSGASANKAERMDAEIAKPTLTSDPAELAASTTRGPSVGGSSPPSAPPTASFNHMPAPKRGDGRGQGTNT